MLCYKLARQGGREVRSQSFGDITREGGKVGKWESKVVVVVVVVVVASVGPSGSDESVGRIMEKGCET